MVKLGAPDIVRQVARQNWIDLFPDTASVYRIHTQSVTDDFGHDTLWELVHTYPAQEWSISAQEAIILGQLAVQANAVLRLPYYADLTEKDQVIYHVKETGDMVHLEVTAVHKETQTQDVKADCIEILYVTPDMPIG